MLVVDIKLWPQGDRERERQIQQVTCALEEASPDGREGAYRVRITHASTFRGGPGCFADPAAPTLAETWQTYTIYHPRTRSPHLLLTAALSAAAGATVQADHDARLYAQVCKREHADKVAPWEYGVIANRPSWVLMGKVFVSYRGWVSAAEGAPVEIEPAWSYGTLEDLDLRRVQPVCRGPRRDFAYQAMEDAVSFLVGDFSV
jgi:hypothetical protein